jgi:hypothetical protein
MIVAMPACARAEPLIVCSDAGMKNDFNDEHPRNAPPSIRVCFDPDSKVNDERDLQEEKQRSQRIVNQLQRCPNEK